MHPLKDYLLRDIEETDLNNVLYWRNSEQIRINMFSEHKISPEEHRAWFERIKQEKSSICRIFEYRGNPLGVVNIFQIDQKNNKCHWGFYIGDRGAPGGSGTIMGYLALEYIFEVMGIRKLCSEVFSFNQASLNYHKKFGFIEEGRLINHILKKQRYEDVIALALFNDKWFVSKSTLYKHLFGGEKINHE